MGVTNPSWRIENLVTDDAVAYTAEVDEAGGEPQLHIRTTGVTSAGPFDPERPTYDLWIDSDHLPVRMESDSGTWTFDYPEGLGDELTSPPADERGSYGYWFGYGRARVTDLTTQSYAIWTSTLSCCCNCLATVGTIWRARG